MTHRRCPIVLDDENDDARRARSSTFVVTVFIVLSSSSLSRSGGAVGSTMDASINFRRFGWLGIHPWIDRFRSPSPRVRARPARRARWPSRARTHERSRSLSRKPLGRLARVVDETDDALESTCARGSKVPHKCLCFNTRRQDRIHLDLNVLPSSVHTS